MQKNALQSETGKWNFWQYDAFGREVMKGETDPIGYTQSYWQNLFNQQTQINEAWDYNAHYYNGVSFPTNTNITYSNVKQYQIYDDYDFAAPEHAFKPDSAYHPRYTNAKGLLTLTVKRDLNLIDQGQFRYYLDTYYYDSKNRPIQIFSTHDMGGANNNLKYNLKNIQYNFAGEILQEREYSQFDSKPAVTSKVQNQYDHVGRPVKFFHGLNTTPIEIVRYKYDNNGRMAQKKLLPNGTFFSGGTSEYIYRPPLPGFNEIDSASKAICLLPGMQFSAASGNSYLAFIDSTINVGTPIIGLQTIDYTHHLRGWLKGINLNSAGSLFPNTSEGDLFSYKLDYEVTGLFDGNIGKQAWHDTKNIRQFNYSYEPSNRLSKASYIGVNSENYAMPTLQYDDNGNILKLSRNGLLIDTYGLTDSLSYTYSGNRLTNVSDAISGHFEVDFKDSVNTVDYEYYSNGNLKKDKNEGIENIVYNTYLNQPSEVQLTNGHWIKYFYDGGGSLIKTIYSPDTSGVSETWHYINDKILKNGNLYQISIPEGRIVFDTSGHHYEFFYTDHLGNVRVAFRNKKGKLEKVSETAFGPFGDILRGLHQKNQTDNRWEYQGHEKENTFGLKRINFGQRTFNPTIGRFDKVDYYTGKYRSLSPFQYTANNPLNIIDKFGDSLDVSLIKKYDNSNQTNYLDKIINDIQSQTGLNLLVNSQGRLDYAKDSQGKPLVSTSTDGSGNTIQNGSVTARQQMVDNISNTAVVYSPISTSNSNAAKGGTLISLNPKQIESFISGAKNIDSRSQGWGMTLMHESLHTILGGGLSDSPNSSGFGPIGDVETKMNIVRSELNAQGFNYGQRQSYQGLQPSYSQNAYIPFDTWSKRHLQNGLIVHPSSKYIIYTP